MKYDPFCEFIIHFPKIRSILKMYDPFSKNRYDPTSWIYDLLRMFLITKTVHSGSNTTQFPKAGYGKKPGAAVTPGNKSLS
jgi:hypothetical protein